MIAAVAIDLGDALAQIATALRVPVLLAAIVVLILCALELGRFGAEYWRRLRFRDVDLRELTATAVADPQHASYYAYSAPGRYRPGLWSRWPPGRAPTAAPSPRLP